MAEQLMSEENDAVELSQHYLDFNDEIKYCNKFYKDYKPYDDFDETAKEEFFKDNLKTLSKYLILVEVVGIEGLRDTNIKYTLLGISVELTLKLCSLKSNWDDYLQSYKANKNNRAYQFAKEFILKDLNGKITPEKYERIEEILKYVQLQRNHFVHNPFKSAEHYATTRQIYILIAFLSVFYDLELAQEAIDVIKEALNKHKVITGSDFKDVGLMGCVNQLESSWELSCNDITSL